MRRLLFVAILAAIGFVLFFPATASAHAVLLRSDPAQDAILHVPPDQVRLWFSEALNPTFSTVSVENAANQQRIDNRDAQLSPDDSSEMLVTLQPHLPPAVYIVIWRSDSNDDGHIEAGSFLYTLARPDGTIPTISSSMASEVTTTGGGNTFTFLTFFNLLMITLLELGAIFWVGALCWLTFVLPPSEDAANEEVEVTGQQVIERFERRFALPLLLLLLLANTGVLLGQALSLSNGAWENAFASSLLVNLVTSGAFGLFWFVRELVIILALRLALHQMQFKRRSSHANSSLRWLNLALGLVLFTTIALSSHAAAVRGTLVLPAVIADWLHLVAAALWIGGMMSIAALYVPLLRGHSIAEQARSLLTVLPSYTPWAVAGVILMAVTGPFSATVQLQSWEQLLTTLYGQVLVIKVLLVGLLLMTSAMHVFWLRPHLKREYAKYNYALTRAEDHPITGEADRRAKLAIYRVSQREKRLATRTRWLTRVLRWEPTGGVAVIVCVGLMNIFAGTLAPLAPTTAQQQQQAAVQQPFHATMETFDHEFTVTLEISPNQLGTNVFTVSIVNPHTDKPVTNVSVDVNTEMLDRDLGVGFVPLKPDGHGQFSGKGDLALSGHWQIIVQIATPNDPYHPHEAYVRLFIS